MVNARNKLKTALGLLFFALTFTGLFLFREELSGEIFGAMVCAVGLLPSLLPFMFLSSLTGRTGLGRSICRIISPLSRFVFRLPSSCGWALTAGMLFGYPVGARLCAELEAAGIIDPETARRLLLFCVNPGLPFCLLYVGGSLWGSLPMGVVLYISLLLSNILFGFLISLGEAVPGKALPSGGSFSLPAAIAQAAASARDASLNMIVYMLIFRGLFALVRSAGLLPGKLCCPGAFLLEVTAGLEEAVSARAAPELTAFGLGFGGLCLIFQIMAFFRSCPAKFTELFFARLAQGIFASGMFLFLRPLIPLPRESLPVFSSLGSRVPGGLEAEPLGALSLVLLFALYILSGNKFVVEKSRKK